jgi:hypothetical protein
MFFLRNNRSSAAEPGHRERKEEGRGFGPSVWSDLIVLTMFVAHEGLRSEVKNPDLITSA